MVVILINAVKLLAWSMATITTFEEMHCWQEARLLNSQLRCLFDAGKFKNNYSLINQMERSAGSIMDNIAEGFERSGNREFVQHLYIAKGLCGELRSQLYRAIDFGYINKEEFEKLSDLAKQISGQLQKLIQYLLLPK